MTFDFLSRLYKMSFIERSYPKQPQERLDPLYLRLPEAEDAFTGLFDVLEALGVDDVSGDITDAVTSLRWAYEKQGFISGFRMGMMLAGELKPIDGV